MLSSFDITWTTFCYPILSTSLSSNLNIFSPDFIKLGCNHLIDPCIWHNWTIMFCPCFLLSLHQTIYVMQLILQIWNSELMVLGGFNLEPYVLITSIICWKLLNGLQKGIPVFMILTSGYTNLFLKFTIINI